jgi:uncharacterized protein
MRSFLIIFYYSFLLLWPLLAFVIWSFLKGNKKPVELVILTLILLVLIWARFFEPSFLIEKKYIFLKNEDNKNSLKVAVFSDVHVGVFAGKKQVERVVRKINKIDPDIVLIPGDFVYYADEKKIHHTLSPLKKIKAPKIAVLGNHDYEKRGSSLSVSIKSALESAGALVVDNKTKSLEVKNSMVEIIGIADLWTGMPDYSVLYKNENKENADLRILLTHNPDTAYEVIDLDKDIKDIDLLIAGHTHAGQIRIPFLYEHVIPTKHRFDRGFYNIEGLNVFVTPGIGNVVLPMRLFNFPEISVIDIKY